MVHEPTGALDSEDGVIVLELLQKLGKEHGNTVVIVTHNADIAKCADKVIRMKNGKISEIVINENPLPVREVEWERCFAKCCVILGRILEHFSQYFCYRHWQ